MNVSEYNIATSYKFLLTERDSSTRNYASDSTTSVGHDRVRLNF
jgi:hypothetical protein